MDNFTIDAVITAALREDIGAGDVTTDGCVPENKTITGKFTAKESGCICGLAVAARVFELLDENIAFKLHAREGSQVEKGGLIAEISGSARAILKGERTALNLLQRMSGIATMTALIAKTLPDGCRVTDTRKTTPGLRALEKYAVRVGGGVNHRFDLAGGVLIKDNHIAAAGGITRAVEAVRAIAPHTLKIEVEASCLDEVKQAIEAGADIIMLDNMDIAAMREAVKVVDRRALIEASGNMADRDIAEVAACGVDFISVGALTHSVKALDISLRLNMDICRA